MPAVRLFLGSVLFILVSFISSAPSHAQTTAPSPSPTPKTTCDECGWCNRYVTPPAPSPFNWQQCHDCLNPSGSFTNKRYYTVFGCIDTDAGPLVQNILRIVFGIAGGSAFLSIIYGAVLVLTSTGDPERLQSGKDTITSSLIGLLLVIFSVFLLRVVGMDILKFPGFE